ncbi:FkbM family methyltransferase [Sulfuritalea sp.]|uniref:FkbM family methyltransferase n=1 Tax=Sulfuritalea sp. TaxID=2480090 RepID=UPI00286E92AE|nr:FkbM family methyltransferase [Sulfuritalea sp.]
MVVDVGARYDTDYIEISGGNGIEYYLFEINPKFYAKLKRKLLRFNENVHAENVAVGERNGFTEYFEDSESVLRSTTGVKNSSMKLGSDIEMVRLDHYLSSKHVTQVDFLKTDIEEYDYFALVGFGEFLNACRYIQFELGIGAPIDDAIVTIEASVIHDITTG